MGKRNRRKRRWDEDESEGPEVRGGPDGTPEIVARADSESELASAMLFDAPPRPTMAETEESEELGDEEEGGADVEQASNSSPALGGVERFKDRRNDEDDGDHADDVVDEGEDDVPETLPHSPLAAASSARRVWTREPVLLALLLVGLIVLSFDTYFTIRLNGLSDRLNAMATKPPAVAAVTTERPWVGPQSVKTEAFAAGGQPITTLHIVNSGRGPAMELRSNTVGSLRSSVTPPPQIPGQMGPLANTAILFPNAGGDLTFFANTRALTADEVANIQSGQYVLWLAGRLDYKDAKGKPHLTTFRYRYDPKLASFSATSDGNTAN
jgi:hypothetical protein